MIDIFMNIEQIPSIVLDSNKSDNLTPFINLVSSTSDNLKSIKEKFNIIDNISIVDKVDIRDVSSIENSRSILSDYDSIYSFGKKMYEIYRKISFEDYIKHVLDYADNGLLDMYYYSWKRCYHFSNSNGSHHFAIAHFLAKEKNINCLLKCNILVKIIRKEKLLNLLKDYSMFVINTDNEQVLQKYLSNDSLFNLNNSLFKLKDKNILILLEKNNSFLDKKYIKLLETKIKAKVFNLNTYLEQEILKI